MSKNTYFPQPDEIPGYPTVLTPQDSIDVIPRRQSLNNPNHILLKRELVKKLKDDKMETYNSR